ncbi:PEP-CTERM sorting domain-containing protein [Novosphingobium sp. M1R2S20]|uniref:PEP-CTERM sorting domain-containing protein n=1 Tax=Novosphingobium rhizovicinum TaxID=3228928 RepID=A0ABV3R8W8_9SPHN
MAAAALLFDSPVRSGGPFGSSIRSPLAVFASRSPGNRADGALFQSKRRLAPARHAQPQRLTVIPRERVLSNIRRRPSGPLTIAPAVPPIAEQGLPLATPPLPPIVPGPAFRSPDNLGAGPTPFLPGGPIFGGPVVDRPPVDGGGPGSAPPAVPEPSTWVLFVASIGFIGIVLRRRHPRPSLADGRAG